MKTKLLLLSIFAAAVASAQTATQNQPAGTLAPITPGLPGSPQSPGLPGFNPQNPILSSATFPTGQGINSTNFFDTFTNLSTADLQAALRNVQAAMEQALPVLAAFNNNLEVGAVGTNGTGAIPDPFTNHINTPSPTPSSGALVSQSLGVNLGQNTSTLSGVPTAPAVATPAPTINGSALATASGTNTFNFIPPLGTDSLPMLTSAPGISALKILQIDMERSLPLLASVTGGTGVTNAPPAVSNKFEFYPSTLTYFRTNGAASQFGAQNPSGRTLTPTGR